MTEFLRDPVGPIEVVGDHAPDSHPLECLAEHLHLALAKVDVPRAPDHEDRREVAERREPVGVVGVLDELGEGVLRRDVGQRGLASLDDEDL